MSVDRITVRTHVARDLLQSAALFKTESLVVWEYVSNGLQYREPGISPVVNVSLDSRRKLITIDDNGCGMDRKGLQNFFVMHGENQERKGGRPGRGRFGTGKSAAFGVADELRVSTIRHGKRNTVVLTREDILSAGEQEIPVRFVERDRFTHEPNGTVITISRIKLRKLDQQRVISFIERHLAHWPEKPLVCVNSHLCEPTEPAVSRARTVKPTGHNREILGDAELTLKVSKSPLESEMQGVAIHANGVWLETTLAGAEGQPMAQYLFGHIDVPALDDESAPIPAFDMSRSMKLNPNNDVVHSVLAFVGFELDRLRRELVKEERERRADEDAKKLEREAHRIAEMINRDFQEFNDRVARVKAKSGTGHDLSRLMTNAACDAVDESVESLIAGGTLNASEEQPAGETGRGRGRGGNGPDPSTLGPVLQHDNDGKPQGQPVGGEGKAKRPRGGFNVQFKDMGEASSRATYVASDRTIYVNLDHPQIHAAKGSGSIDDPVFRRLAYEVAFSEYAIALAIEMDNNGEFIEPSDAMVEIREALNRMARRSAVLYAL